MSHTSSCLWPRRKPKAQVTARKGPALIHLLSNQFPQSKEMRNVGIRHSMLCKSIDKASRPFVFHADRPLPTVRCGLNWIYCLISMRLLPNADPRRQSVIEKGGNLYNLDKEVALNSTNKNKAQPRENQKMSGITRL